MCTVTFVSSLGKTIITSNRDEQTSRPSLAPRSYEVNGKKLFFPKDPRAGGTWFVSDENSNVLVVLNGAFAAHEHRPPYRRSRGLIALDLLSQASAFEAWQNIDLTNVEPFTIVLFENHKLYDLRWDGEQKSTARPDENASHIWSSATLYPREIRQAREGWFADFLAKNPSPDAKMMLGFHRYTESGDSQNGLVINREGIQLQTLSITQAVVQDNRLEFSHSDLISDSISKTACITV